MVATLLSTKSGSNLLVLVVLIKRFSMIVKKFGGTSVGTPQRIKDVANLVCGKNDDSTGCSLSECIKRNKSRNFLVLSAMSGTTNALLEIAGAMKAANKELANSLIGKLENKYESVCNDLFDDDKEGRTLAWHIVSSFFNDLYHLASHSYSEQIEKEIVAFGELISTNLMHRYLRSQGVRVLQNSAKFRRLKALES